MDIQYQRKVTELAGQAFEIDGSRRDAWLEQACEGNDKLLRDVSVLLEVMDSGASFTRLDSLKPDVETEAVDDRIWLGKTIGSYRILKKLGEGGMGWVFLAEQTEPIERKVALKIIKPFSNNNWQNAKLQTVFPPHMKLTIGKTANASHRDLASFEASVSERIQAEPQVLAKFTHPYIAQVYEAGKTAEGFVYFAMEYVSGEPLSDYCRTVGLTLEQRLYLLMKVCRGVQHAHHIGVLHLDLKPSNILVSDIDGTASPKVIDFGIAMTTDPHGESRLRRNLAMGTPIYMCPEALSDEDVFLDARADVFALGVIMFELITDSSAHNLLDQTERFPDATSMKGAFDLPGEPGSQRAKVLSPRRVKRALPRDLDWIVQKATSANRDERYLSPAELAADLKRFFNGKPVEAAPPTPFYLTRKFVARHKWVTTGAGLIMAITIAGLWFLWTSYRRAEYALEASRRTSQFLTAVIDHTSWQSEDLDLNSFLDNAEHMVNRQLDAPSLTRAQYLMLLADVYSRTGRHERAAPLIQEALEIAEENTPNHPGLVPFLMVRGGVFQAEGRLDEAAADFQRAIRISEHRLDARKMDRPLYLLASVYDAGARYEECEAVCRRALDLIGEEGRSRNKVRLLELLAKILRKQGREDEAIEYERRLADMPPPPHLGPPPPRN